MSSSPVTDAGALHNLQCLKVTKPGSVCTRGHGGAGDLVTELCTDLSVADVRELLHAARTDI